MSQVVGHELQARAVLAKRRRSILVSWEIANKTETRAPVQESRSRLEKTSLEPKKSNNSQARRSPIHSNTDQTFGEYGARGPIPAHVASRHIPVQSKRRGFEAGIHYSSISVEETTNTHIVRYTSKQRVTMQSMYLCMHTRARTHPKIRPYPSSLDVRNSETNHAECVIDRILHSV